MDEKNEMTVISSFFLPFFYFFFFFLLIHSARHAWTIGFLEHMATTAARSRPNDRGCKLLFQRARSPVLPDGSGRMRPCIPARQLHIGVLPVG